MHATLEYIAKTQFKMKQGLQAFGNDGVDVLLHEIQQLHIRRVIEPKTIHSALARRKEHLTT
jgi:hypothetical protein